MLEIVPIPALTGTYDNYIWILHDGISAIVVDPGDAMPVLAYLQAHQLKLSAILITHRHNDHIGGIPKLLEVYNTRVYGPRSEMIPTITHHIGEGDSIEIEELGLRFDILHLPGHLPEHIVYVGNGMLFCGDILFGCGCGKMFVGTPQEFHHSLQRLATLPEDTKVYCAHEYTESNIRFALLCEPNNVALQQRQRDTRALRQQDQSTLPSTIALEKATNPFMRCDQPEIATNVMRHFEMDTPPADEAAVFAALRAWRDHF
ncbi:MAG: hydroxyacylglutathione [Gallionellaceae bacterium]|nr:MAG: hydroxyacylglutathione [Gallionellaceae bacterium]